MMRLSMLSVLLMASAMAVGYAAPAVPGLSPSPVPAKTAPKTAPGTDIPILPAVEDTPDTPGVAAAAGAAPKGAANAAAAATPKNSNTSTTAATATGTEEPTSASEKDAETAAADAEAQAAAAAIDIDLSTIPKIAAVGEVVTSGSSTTVGQKNAPAKAAKSEEVPLTGFEPVWPQDKPNNKDQILVDVVTDSSIDTIKTNQVPFIQSLADALGISTNQIYWYKLTKSDLNTAWFLVDTTSQEEKQAVLASLANPDNTARFYTNAAAYTLNILNGPEVAPEELNLSADVISTPDKASAYNGDTGLITNNATATSSAYMAGAQGGLTFEFLLKLGAVAVALMISTILV